MNIKSLLSKSILELKKSGIPTPELDARVLLVSAMEEKDAFVYSHPEHLITNAQYSKFRRYIRKRKTGEPIAYIVGHKEFYGYDFVVNKNVLVPRPESEWLVEKGTEFLSRFSVVSLPKGDPPLGDSQLLVLDMGTGSGCIAISLSNSLLATYPLLHTTKIYAVDNSSRAVAVAKKNAHLNNAENIVFLNSNLFGNRRIKNKIFNLIVANLPYVPHNKKVVSLPKGDPPLGDSQLSAASSIDFEPQEAIFADDNGASIIKNFLKEAKSHTKSGSLILIELDPRNANDLLQFAKKQYPDAKIDLHQDLASDNRYLEILSK